MRYTRNDRRESRNAIYGEVNGIIPNGNFLFRTNDGVTYDHVYTMTSSTLLDVRAGWQRFKEPNVRQHEGHLRSGDARVLVGGGRPVRRREVLPALRPRSVLGRRREPVDGHEPHHLLVPADADTDFRQPFAAYRLRLPSIPGARHESGCAGGRIRVSQRQCLYAPPGQLHRSRSDRISPRSCSASRPPAPSTSTRRA